MDTLPPTGDMSDVETPGTYGATLDPRPGMVLADRYELVAPLGRGSSGWVWEARHTIIGKSFAIKLLAPRTGSFDDEAAVRMLREANTLSSLDHPNVIAVTDFGHAQGGTPFIVMELLQGRPLRAVLDDGPLSWRRARAWAVQILEGVEAAHREGVIHRDLKPANLFVTDKDDRIKVLDFGLARAPRPPNAAAAESSAHLRAMGAVFGTPATMSPEQIGGGAVDTRSDVYSIGCVLYEMIAGRPPLQGAPAELLYQHVYVDPSPLRELAPPEVPDAVCEMVHRCLQKDPNERPSDIKLVREAFDRRSRKRTTSRVLVRSKSADLQPPEPKPNPVAWRVIAGAAVAAGALFGLVAAATPGPRTPVRSVELRLPRVSSAAVSSPSLRASLPVVEQARPKLSVKPQAPLAPPKRGTARKPKRKPKRSPAEATGAVQPSKVKPRSEPRAPVEDPENSDLKNPFDSR